MRRFLRLLTAALAGALTLGCGDSPRMTGPADPTAPSPRVERFGHLDAFVFGGDPTNPLALQIGFDAGVTVEDICTGSPGLPNGLGQLILTPPGGALLHGSGQDVNLVVYEFGGGPVTDPCQVVGAPVVGSGTGNFTYNILTLSNGAFVAHITAHGIIDLTSGGQARVLGTARVLILPDGTLKFDVEQVRLTPL
jgi:hypothetical protein